jgi:nucleoside-diphosphate-sugar epimerase
MNKKKSVLIIGVNSLLSVNIIHQLKSLNKFSFEITGVFNNKTNNINKLGINLISYNDYLNIEKDFDFVFIIAAHIPYSKPLVFSNNLINKNILLVSKICDKNKNAKIIFCSSVSIYGNDNNEEILETSLPNPQTAYSISKLTGEKICLLHKKYAIVRLSSIYGKGINTPTFIPRAIEQAKNQSKIILYGDGSRKQNYINVKDAANYLIKSAFYEKNGIFLGTSKKEYSNLEISNLIIKYSKNSSEIIFKDNDESKNSIYNCTSTIKSLNIETEVDIETGIKEMML